MFSTPEAGAVRDGPSAAGLRSLLGEMEEALGTRVCIVGGYVRDLVMGRPAAADVDLVVERVPAEMAANWLRQRWHRREPVVAFERYGTAQISFLLEGGERLTVEFVRARSEAYSRESRKPTVRAGTMEEDAIRRDFTINTLLLDSAGVVSDPTGRGLDDLRAGLLRTPLDPLLTFDEDPLRMFRAARFASQLGFALEPGVEAAMAQAGARIEIVSKERIRDELVKLLLGDAPSTGLRLLLRSGLLAKTIPELARLSGVEQGGYHPDDVFEHTVLAVDLALKDKLVRLAVLFHDIGKPSTAQPSPQGPTFLRHQQVGAEISREVMRRLRFSGTEIDQVARLVELHMRPIQYGHEWADSAVRRLWHDAGALVPQLLALARADTLSSTYPGTEELDELERRMAALARDNPQGIRPPLGGNQLKAHFRLGDGPWIGRAQRLLMEAMVEGRLGAGDGSLEERALLLLEADRPSWQPRPSEPGRSPEDAGPPPR
ncbi:MAG: CCA tRNA nucleotidyltransferase [Candidatus Dormibacteria bacterium]